MSYSDSDGEGNLLVVDDNGGEAFNATEVDDSICPTCGGSTYVGETISCETCTYWFHFTCVGVSQADACVQREDVPFYCKNCKKTSKKKASRKSLSKPKSSAKAKTPKKPKSTKKQQPPTAPITATLPASKTTASPPIKLKISFGRKRAKAETVSEVTPTIEPDSAEDDRTNKRRKRLKSEDEEEKWLDAVESGNLHAVDAELKSIRDPKLMTARQRAMVIRKTADDVITDEDVGHMALAYTTSRKEKNMMQDEEELKQQKAIKSAKRKEIEQEKREQDKKKTMDRLLNKKESSVIKASLKSLGSNPSKESAPKVPKIVYRDTREGPSLTFPPNFPIPIPKMEPRSPPRVIKCSVKSCLNVKKYNCSKTGKPLCSLQCYKKNLLISA